MACIAKTPLDWFVINFELHLEWVSFFFHVLQVTASGEGQASPVGKSTLYSTVCAHVCMHLPYRTWLDAHRAFFFFFMLFFSCLKRWDVSPGGSVQSHRNLVALASVKVTRSAARLQLKVEDDTKASREKLPVPATIQFRCN